nr:hypothetical protein [uncultured Mucilaginibacter sp.]
MNTKIIMASSAIILAAIGISLMFLPEETLLYLNIGVSKPLLLILQLLGGLYFGFAMLNWMSQWSLIGGIYNKPVSVANFAQFFVGGLALLKEIFSNPEIPYAFWILGGFYALYAVVFGLLFYGLIPVKAEQN